MDDEKSIRGAADTQSILHLRQALEDGISWPKAVMEAMALWSLPEEIYRGTRLVYLVAYEAFDWLTLAHRLCSEVEDLVPVDELEEFLFSGRFPSYVNQDDFKEILGPDKYSAYLNFFYGVEVETALQHVVEAEIEKRFYASGRQYTADHTDSAFQRIYRGSRESLLTEFREAHGRAQRPVTTLTELKEFTYWLFKRRLRVSDKAKIASDTRKGIAALNSTVRVPEELSALAS